MTMIGLPPAGGWVTFNNIIKPTPKPTATGIIKYRGSGTKYKKNKPTIAVSRCPKNIFWLRKRDFRDNHIIKPLMSQKKQSRKHQTLFYKLEVLIYL